MNSENLDNPDSSEKYIKCTNCHQNIQSSKMFLHEGFCLRNNTYCFECGKVVLKKDFEAHLNNHSNIKPQRNSNKEIKEIKQIENNNEKKNESPILVSQINYNSCVNMNYQNPKRKEIIKYNEPIIITTADNGLHSPEEYKEFFIKNYRLAKSLNINEIDLSYDQFNNNIYERNHPTEINGNPNLNNIQKNIETDVKIIKQPILKNHENQNYDKQIYINNNYHENRSNVRKKNALLPTHEKLITCTKFENNLYKKFNDKELISQYKNIYNTEIKEPKNSPKKISKIVPIGKNYQINNFLIRENIPNKNDKIPKQVKNNQKIKKEPLDRTSRLAKKNKKANIEKKQLSNMKYIEIVKQKNKYQKCEYCGHMVEDYNAHMYRCQNRRLKEIERIQSKQEDKKTNNIQNYMYNTTNGNNYFYKQQTTSRIRPKYYINDKKENLRGQETVARKRPMDSSREKQILRTQVRNFHNIDGKNNLYSLEEYAKTPEKVKNFPESRDRNYKNNENRKYRNAKTPLKISEKSENLDYYVRLII